MELTDNVEAHTEYIVVVKPLPAKIFARHPSFSPQVILQNLVFKTLELRAARVPAIHYFKNKMKSGRARSEAMSKTSVGFCEDFKNKILEK